MKLELRKGGITRIIQGRTIGAPRQIVIGGEVWDLTSDIGLTNGTPLLEFRKDGGVFYIREKFNKTDSIRFCAQTPTPYNSSRVYMVDDYKIESRAVNLTRLKIDVRVSTAGSHRNDGDRIARGYVVLKALDKGNLIFDKQIWYDQTNGGDGASGFEAGTVFNQSLSSIMGDSSTNIYDLEVSIFLSTGDYQANVSGGRSRYQRVHGICVTVYD